MPIFLYSLWMDGPMSGVNPDVVEQEVGNLWRSLYKLEKQFESVFAAKKIAQKVSATILYCKRFTLRKSTYFHIL